MKAVDPLNKKTHKLDAKQRAKAKREWLKGTKVKDIAAMVGCRHQNICAMARSHDWPERPPYTKLLKFWLRQQERQFMYLP